MRLAALYDVHGNLPALEAVLDAVRDEAVDLVVVGGDVLPGPMPGEALARLASLDLPTRFLRGNGDRVVAACRAGGDIDEVPEPFRGAIRWCADRIDDRQARAIAAWPATIEVDVTGLGTVLFCHATPRSDLEVFTRTTAVERLLPVFSGVRAGTVVCGHTHMPFDRQVGRHRVVNPGSVGMPFAGPRGACWLLLGPGVELRRTEYDVDAAAARLRATGYPDVERTAVACVLAPPPEEESLRRFSGVELG